MPWGHNLVLLSQLKNQAQRLLYAQRAMEHGWSRSILTMQIETRRIEREGQALTNFTVRLQQADTDLARQSLKDPYPFDFLRLGHDAHEREIETALIQHLTQLLLELGAGCAFVGRQVHLEVDGKILSSTCCSTT